MVALTSEGGGLVREDTTSLKAKLRRAERVNRMRSLSLVAPLLIFVLAVFVLPIGLMMFRAIENTEVRDALPKTIAALQDWDGTATPDEPVFAAFAADLVQTQKDRTTAGVGKRINYEVPGARSRFLKAGRLIDAGGGGPWKEKFLAADPEWGSVPFWAIMKRAGRTYTPYYLLNSLDLRQDATGAIVRNFPDQSIFLDILFRTIWISFLVTAATLILGYPVAHLLAILPPKHANLLMILVLLPFTTSILVRTTAWIVLLQSSGVINDVLLALHITTERVQLIFNRFGTVLAMTQIQLPFTILPIYSVMKSIPAAHVRAARSLGAGPLRAFVSVYMPQTLPGVGAGCLLTFILSLGYYITPALVGGPQDQMISYFVALYTNREMNWGQASALGAILLLITLGLYALFNRFVGIDKVKLG
ncbi:ABC transporter permease [Ancylobacter sp. 6x-1]|uniref:ABC transporter permease n=1 Tax=Ancylobacter crimeensis TaxID=2579147 RepID=A0ABT0DB99_9HYPH|nr:ABC transporter permease [Ancylobacter crimeensis]MCK0197149.1 ABC transporter permease [Ancylobacter crimeensis]